MADCQLCGNTTEAQMHMWAKSFFYNFDDYAHFMQIKIRQMTSTFKIRSFRNRNVQSYSFYDISFEEDKEISSFLSDPLRSELLAD